MNWPELELKKVAQVASGFGFPRECQGLASEEFPFFKVGDMNLSGNERCMITVVNTISSGTLHKLKAKTFPKGTVIFPKIGAAIATNKKRMLTRPSVVDNNVMGVIPGGLLNEWYLYYWFQQFDLRKVTNIGPVPSMRKTEVENVLIPLPTLSEQERIVEILRKLDELRDLRANANDKAVRILGAIFAKHFGDPAMNSMGWRACKLGEVIIETQYGTSLKSTEFGERLVPLIRMNNIDFAGYLDLENIKYVSLPDKEHLKLALKNGDILFNRTNSRELVGKTGLWDGQMEAVCASYLIRVRVDTNKVTPEYVWAYLNTPFMKQVLFDTARRAIGMANINSEELKAFPILVPPRDAQQTFSRKVAVLGELRNDVRRCTRDLNSLFSTFLHQAFSGRLTAKWREAHLKKIAGDIREQARILNLPKEALQC
jgi:type I restriction enzyme S subunit